MKVLPISIFLIMFPLFVCAETTTSKQEEFDFVQNMKIRPYISLKLGYNNNKIQISDISSKDFTNNTFSLNPAFGLKFDSSAFGIFAFRLEAEYLHNTSDSNSYVSQRSWTTGLNYPYLTYNYETRKDTVKANASGALFNTYIDIKTPIFITPFITTGLGYGELTQENQIVVDTIVDSWNSSYDSTEHTSNSEKHSASNMFWQIGLGASFNITESFSLNTEYRYLNYGSITVYGSELKYKANQFLIGTKYIF